MDARLQFLVFILIAFTNGASGKLGNLKLCVVGNPSSKSTRTVKYCDLLEKSKKNPVSCVYAADRLECLWLVSKQKADFSVLEPEDLFFSTLWDESSILVVSEVRALKKKPFRHEFVVVVRSDSNVTGIGDLKGKRLCHPGLESGPEWDQLFAQYFEERVAPAACDEDLSVLEDRIKTTASYFGSACKPGPWSLNAEEDARLKSKYWNLCSLCDGGDCGNSDKYRGSGGSIICLKDAVGDILWARYEDIKAHFQFLDSDSGNKFYYMCGNGNLMPLTTDEPCFWLAKPWQVVVSNRKSASSVQKIVNILSDDDDIDWKENLLHVIELYMAWEVFVLSDGFKFLFSSGNNFQEYIQNLLVSLTPEDYLRHVPGYLSASGMSQSNCNPKHSVSLCVTSTIEKQKCDWMSKAGSALGIQPSLECLQKPDVAACLDSVEKEETDVMSVTADFFYDAAVKHNLKTFLMETGSRLHDNYLASAVLKKKSGVKKLSDLKGKKICLTRKHGVGWWAVLSALHSESLIGSYCKGLHDFFGGVCVLNAEEGEDVERCCPEENLGGGEIDLLHCLKRDGCDVAVLDFNFLTETSVSPSDKNVQPESNGISLSEFKTLCESAEKTVNCHWMWSYPNYLMSHAEPESKKALEILSVFSQLSAHFGGNSLKSNSILKIFGPFHGVKNALFRDLSASFVPFDKWNHSQSYYNTLGRMKVCSKAPQQSALFLFTLLPTVAYFLSARQ